MCYKSHPPISRLTIDLRLNSSTITNLVRSLVLLINIKIGGTFAKIIAIIYAPSFLIGLE